MIGQEIRRKLLWRNWYVEFGVHLKYLYAQMNGRRGRRNPEKPQVWNSAFVNWELNFRLSDWARAQVSNEDKVVALYFGPAQAGEERHEKESWAHTKMCVFLLQLLQMARLKITPESQHSGEEKKRGEKRLRNEFCAESLFVEWNPSRSDLSVFSARFWSIRRINQWSALCEVRRKKTY